MGAIIAGPLSDFYGRKPIIILADVMFTFGSFFMYQSKTVNELIIGRIIVGLGVGLSSLIVPVYLSEISPKKVRGTVVAFDICLICTGQFVASCLGYYLGTNWRLMLGVGAVPSAIQLMGMLTLPES